MKRILFLFFLVFTISHSFVFDKWSFGDEVKHVIAKADMFDYCIDLGLSSSCLKSRGFKKSNLYNYKKGMHVSNIYYSDNIFQSLVFIKLYFSDHEKLYKIKVNFTKNKEDTFKLLKKHFYKKYKKPFYKTENKIIWKYKGYNIKIEKSNSLLYVSYYVKKKKKSFSLKNKMDLDRF